MIINNSKNGIEITDLTIHFKEMPMKDNYGHIVYVQVMAIEGGYRVSDDVHYFSSMLVDDPDIYAAGEDVMQYVVNKINNSYKVALNMHNDNIEGDSR